MANKIVPKSINPPVDKLGIPDGEYVGTWSGYQIEFTAGGIAYTAATEDGVRGFGIPVIVAVNGGRVTFKQR